MKPVGRDYPWGKLSVVAVALQLLPLVLVLISASAVPADSPGLKAALDKVAGALFLLLGAASVVCFLAWLIRQLFSTGGSNGIRVVSLDDYKPLFRLLELPDEEDPALLVGGETKAVSREIGRRVAHQFREGTGLRLASKVTTDHAGRTDRQTVLLSAFGIPKYLVTILVPERAVPPQSDHLVFRADLMDAICSSLATALLGSAQLPGDASELPSECEIAELVTETIRFDISIVDKQALAKTGRFLAVGWKQVVYQDDRPLSLKFRDHRCECYQSDFAGTRLSTDRMLYLPLQNSARRATSKPASKETSNATASVWVCGARHSLGLQCWDLVVPSELLARPVAGRVDPEHLGLRRGVASAHDSEQTFAGSELATLLEGGVELRLCRQSYDTKITPVSKAFLHFEGTDDAARWAYEPVQLDRIAPNRLVKQEDLAPADENPLVFQDVAGVSMMKDSELNRLFLTRPGHFVLSLGRSAGEDSNTWYIEPLVTESGTVVPLFVKAGVGAGDSEFARVSARTPILQETTIIRSMASEGVGNALRFRLNTGSPPPSILGRSGEQDRREVNTLGVEDRVVASFLRRYCGVTASRDQRASQCVARAFEIGGVRYWAKLYGRVYADVLVEVFGQLVPGTLGSLQDWWSRFASDGSFMDWMSLDSDGRASQGSTYIAVVQRDATVLKGVSGKSGIGLKVSRMVEEWYSKGVMVTDLVTANLGLFRDEVVVIDLPAFWPKARVSAGASSTRGRINLGTKRQEIPVPEEWESELRPEPLDAEGIQVFLLGVLLVQFFSGDDSFVAYDLETTRRSDAGAGRVFYEKVVPERVREKLSGVETGTGIRRELVELAVRCHSFRAADRPRLGEVIRILETLEA